jgi:hypothetical protein
VSGTLYSRTTFDPPVTVDADDFLSIEDGRYTVIRADGSMEHGFALVDGPLSAAPDNRAQVDALVNSALNDFMGRSLTGKSGGLGDWLIAHANAVRDALRPYDSRSGQ